MDCAKAFDCVDNNKLWKTLKEMGTPDHLTCLLRNLYAGQEATVRTLYGTTDWFRIEKGVWQSCLLSLCLTYTQSTWWEMLGWMSYKLESRSLGEISTTSVICRWYHSNGRKWRGTKELLEERENGPWKIWLKTQIQKITCPITSWQIDGEPVKTVTDFTFLGSKITGDGDCRHENKRCLLLGRKAMTNLDSITLPTNVHSVKAIVFPVVMYGCEI